MKDEIILKLIRSFSEDDVKIGLNFLLEKYPKNTGVVEFFEKYGEEHEDDAELETGRAILETNLNKWILFESDRNLMFAVEKRMWLYKSKVEGAWNYESSHFKAQIL